MKNKKYEDKKFRLYELIHAQGLLNQPNGLDFSYLIKDVEKKIISNFNAYLDEEIIKTARELISAVDNAEYEEISKAVQDIIEADDSPIFLSN